ncbi:SigE family RNA polymerase sigma factor [Dactylosporangium sp. AC04546]|uniref:SigE family RNA polymerase sigma factor n=1 Tax=Dactylosporangium sp. AC04546 TaxID=2862460 RepID=UPI001EE09215|nr:SigE family RNA polymerase sigma factor [Dactylosporangium sp. AC04546]WVK80874.1 SigE family RNA polymerase sigma factor [Dactylosporangium sp. AC04546]
MDFHEYVYARGPALLRLACLLTGDPHRAEDLVQEVLVSAYTKWHRISTADRPDVYMRRMLVNANISWWRRLTNREVAIDAVPDRRREGDHEQAVADRDAMWRLISALPPKQRAVLVLRYYEDLDDAAIAGILSCSTTTVRTHAARGLATLRRHFPAPSTSTSGSAT